MEKSKLEKKEITIVWVESKQMSNGGFMTKLKADDKCYYTIFHTKKDGTDTKAFEGLKRLPMSGIGCKAEILYKEDTYEREGTTHTSKQIVGITGIASKKEVEVKQQETMDDVLKAFAKDAKEASSAEKASQGNFNPSSVPF